MYFRLLRNDILNSIVITLTTMLFVTAAALLAALAAILVVHLSGAIDALMTEAKTPHFMQMHAGDLDSARLAEFAEQNEAVEDFQVLEFLNVDGAQFLFSGGSLANSVQDNGFAVQSEKFDFLLDLDGNKISVSDGEIYVPITYIQNGIAQVGETVVIAGKTFTIAGMLRDSQMQPLLSSSKRFLVSQEDFAALTQFGRIEYLIEFRLHDLKSLGRFGADYTTAELEANGPTLTYPLFRMFNALSDGLMIAVILLISALVIAIAFLCIRFTLLAKIEEDYREIGVMKAIGLSVFEIKKIYLAKYTVIAAVGCLLGYWLSFVFQDVLLENIRMYMGESENIVLAPLLGMISVLMIFLVISLYVNNLLGRFRKVSPVEAVRFGKSTEKSTGGNRFQLSKNQWLGVNIFLGVKDVLTRKGLYTTMLLVLVLSTFMVIVPQNLHNTISSNRFITYMGLGDSDLRIDIQQTDHIVDKAEQIAAVMENDKAISDFILLTTKTFRVKLDDGSEERIKIEFGDHSAFPLSYAEGRAPVAENEIALSALNASEMNKKVGDAITIIIDDHETTLAVCGIYSDVTNGGKTAKAVFTDDSADTMWSVISAQLSDPALLDQKVVEYADRFTFAKVSDVDEFIRQTYGETISAIGKASLVATIIALVITLLITLLFMRMLVAKDHFAIAVMKAFGFRNLDIKTQYLARSVFVLVVGIVLGTLLANTLGEILVGAVIASFGAASFNFIVNPWYSYLLNPFVMTGMVLIGTLLGTLDTVQIKIYENIKE